METSLHDDASALTSVRALLFDLDGVLTPTVDVHIAAWGRLFTDYLGDRGVLPGYSDSDYFRYIDGKPRIDGVRDLLGSRDIRLPEGDPDDAPGLETVWGLGNRKNHEFSTVLETQGVTPYPGSTRLLDALRGSDKRVAVVSSSRNARRVLEVAGLLPLFPVVVDGMVAAEHGLAGKPAPDTYVFAAHQLGLQPSECAVLEDALSGVEAGRAGGFGVVVGVDRGVGADALRASGAHLVVSDLAELVPWASALGGTFAPTHEPVESTHASHGGDA